MKRPLDISPFGTAHDAVVRANAASADSAEDAERKLFLWYDRVREPLRALYGIEDEVAVIAWELARWQEGLGLIEQQALILLVLSALVRLRQGSSRIRLRRPGGASNSHGSRNQDLGRNRSCSRS